MLVCWTFRDLALPAQTTDNTHKPVMKIKKKFCAPKADNLSTLNSLFSPVLSTVEKNSIEF